MTAEAPTVTIFVAIPPDGGDLGDPVTDDLGRLIAADHPAVADRFAFKLAGRGCPVSAVRRNPNEVAEIVEPVVEDPDDEAAYPLYLIEAACEGLEDALIHAEEVALRVPLVEVEEEP